MSDQFNSTLEDNGNGSLSEAPPDFTGALEASLWNSTVGRRAFLESTGAATAGTAIAHHGLKREVLAGSSAPLKPRRRTYSLLMSQDQMGGWTTNFQNAMGYADQPANPPPDPTPFIAPNPPTPPANHAGGGTSPPQWTLVSHASSTIKAGPFWVQKWGCTIKGEWQYSSGGWPP